MTVQTYITIIILSSGYNCYNNIQYDYHNDIQYDIEYHIEYHKY